jgi:hypothetical protein
MSCLAENATLDTFAYAAFGCFLEWGLIHILGFFTMLPPAIKGQFKEINAISMSKLPEATQWKQYEALQADGTAIEDNQKGVPVFSTRQHMQLAICIGGAGVSSIVAGIITAWYPSRYMWWVGFPAFVLDFGYWVCSDLIDAGNFIAEIQTYIISFALIVCSIKTKQCYGDDVGMWELAYMLFFPSVLFLVGAVVKVLYVTGIWKCPLSFESDRENMFLQTEMSSS